MSPQVIIITAISSLAANKLRAALTLLGIVTLVKLMQFWNAANPMLVTGFPTISPGIMRSPVALSG